MANPAVKNGHLKIANELAEHLATVSISGSEWRIIWVVWRQTWGWEQGDRRKDWDWISTSQFEKKTGMKHANCIRELKSLVVKRILLKENNRLKFNQNYNEWLVVKRIPPVVKAILPSSQTTTKTGSQKDTHKYNKATNTKTIPEKENYFSLDSAITHWNKRLVWPNDSATPPNKTVIKRLFLECRGVTKSLQITWNKVNPTQEEWEFAIKAYVRDIASRNPNNDYANHRFSFYEFIKQKNGYLKFLNR